MSEIQTGSGGQPTQSKPATCKVCEQLGSPHVPAAGLSMTLCRRHIEHKARHGHPTRPSLSGALVARCESLVRGYFTGNSSASAALQSAALRVRNILLTTEDCGQVYPRKVHEKVRAVLGRLYLKYCGERRDGIRTRWPRRRSLDDLAQEVVVLCVAVNVACRLQTSDDHYRDTQIGKAIFRRAGGWHRRVEREDLSVVEFMEMPDGTFKRGPAVYRDELNRYAISRGPALTRLGGILWSAVVEPWEAHGHTLLELAQDIRATWTSALKKKGGHRPLPGPATLARPHDKRRKLTRAL